jgi:hypothetical protein
MFFISQSHALPTLVSTPAFTTESGLGGPAGTIFKSSARAAPPSNVVEIAITTLNRTIMASLAGTPAKLSWLAEHN